MCSNVARTTRFSLYILLLNCVLFKQQSSALILSDLYPFGRGNGDKETARLDDGGSGRINIDATFKFFGRNYTKLFVNNNGIITFDAELKVYKPQNFPSSENHPIIAPFWADVDTQRIGGNVWYRQTDNATLLERASAEIRSYFIEQRLFRATWMLIATWENVGFYGAAGNGKSKRNTFQAILITNEKRSFALFNYIQIDWTTGSNSGADTQTGLGGSPAQAGFNAGDGKNYYSIEGAQTPAVVNFTLTSNVGISGKWVFRVDGKSVEDVKCHHAVQIKLHPQSGSMLGGEEIRVSGPCFSFDFKVHARIYETNTTFPCTVLNDVTASCVTPSIFRTGEVTFELNPYNLGWNYSSVFSLVNLADMVPKISVDINRHYSWNPADFPSNNNSKLELLQYEVNKLGQPEFHVVLQDDILNAGGDVKTALSYNLRPSWSTAILRISWNANQSGDSLPSYIWSNPFPVSVDRDYSRQWCKNWTVSQSEKSNLTNIDGACPCTLAQAAWDTGRFHVDSFCNIRNADFSSTNCIYRSGASQCVQRNLQSGTSNGEICCYDSSGELIDIRNKLGGGYHTRYHYRTQGNNIVPYFSYFEEDELPYFHCCQNSEDNDLCLSFISYRPPTTCQSYEPPTPAQAAGDPHISTLDGRDYTFNGIGDFVLVEDTNQTVVIQVRAQQAKDTNGATQNASIFSAVVISALGLSDVVEIHKPEENDEEDVNIIVNGQSYSMESDTAQLNGVTLYRDTNTFRVVLESVSLSLSVDVLPDLLNLLVMVGENSLKGQLRGLLGNFNGNSQDDFMSRNGSVLPFNSTMESLHFDFGMTWKVSNEENLFSDTRVSQTTSSGVTSSGSSSSQNDATSSFTPVFVDKIESSTLRNGTLELCGDVVQCIFDYQVTGNENLAKSTLNAVEKFKSIQEDVRKVARCPFLYTPTNGNKTITGQSPGDNATFTCNDDYRAIQGNQIRVCQEDGSWSGDEVVCAEPIVPTEPGLDTRLLYIAVGSGSGGAVVLFIVISLVICCKCAKKAPPVQEESALDLPTIFPPSNIPCRVFENEAFMTSLQQLNSGGPFKIPRPSYVDPTIFDEYFF